MDDGLGARGSSVRDDVEVFATGTTVVRAPDPVDEPPPVDLDRLLRRGGNAVRDGYQHARDVRARPGHRPGGAVSQAGSRKGSGTDIVRPVLIDPITACRLAVSGELFEAPLDHLQIERDGSDIERSLMWGVRVTADHGRSLPATLHLLASPSMVVTVLELVPRRRLRWARDRFVRDGITAIEELAHRLERNAA